MAKPKKQEIRETSGGAFQTNSPEGTRRYGSVGRFSAYVEVKIMDPVTGIALPPCKQGELWLRGPTITRVVEGRPVREACLPCCGIGLGWFLYLLTLKSYMRNRSRPDGSIVEGCLAKEYLTFCSRC
ncbi:uncharacterized protein LOC131239989 isoform X3 [Magnolia sinica]|uniref:uncharacterized protein LOC131239989 isoform X3 n=1 Tax=Magnolia sinica TaxID=86752 RepID=UPI0026597C2F|nr:uncharacterized protein LOC131239989 isoform X3 [Magnolia sinica]